MSNSAGSTDYRSLMANALREIRELKARLREVERTAVDPIAVIGMGCRFPGGGDSPEAFWQLLRDGTHAIVEVPPDRWPRDRYYDPNPAVPGKMYTCHGGFVHGVYDFDPVFFSLSPKETLSLDPQQRLLLEVSWEALEHAGLAPDRLTGSKAGVFVGICSNDYYRLVLNQGLEAIDAYLSTGTAYSIASGRLSYVLGFQGPSISVDTACSSSLVTVHLACQSLHNRECDLALAGGVNLMLAPEFSIAFSKAYMLSPDGRCNTFGAEANGYVRGEGCGVVVLKRWRDARADGDRILALIRGTAVNQDGHSSGLTVPNGPSQQAVIRQALARAGIEPHQVGYVEAHGTGTPLGDPIEVGALSGVFGVEPREAPLLIGSVKANIGHLEAGAGIAGLIKVVLSLQHEEVPPQPNFAHPNPLIAWDKLPVQVPTSRTPWLRPQGTRIAGVSSFSLGGTNAHLVVEEPPECRLERAAMERPHHLLALSAKDEKALADLASRYTQHLAAHPEITLPDVCFTANTGRAHFRHRLALTASDMEQLRAGLAACTAGRDVTRADTVQADTDVPVIAFLCSGQGSQYAGMGRQLYDTQPTFRTALDRCCRVVEPLVQRPLLDVLYPTSGDTAAIDATAYTQPALFALEYALAALWQSWGIAPAVVLGHSVGEYVAACIAGVFSLEDGLKLIAARARLMQDLPRDGAMVAVFADEEQVAAVIHPARQELAIAAVNGPHHVVIAGRKTALGVAVERLQENGIETRPLQVSHAFHSPLMEPMLADFERVLRDVTFALPQLDLISNLTGALVTDEVATPAYWLRHVRQSVRFSASLETLAHLGGNVLVEIGPKPTLLGLTAGWGKEGTLRLPSLRQGRPDWEPLLTSLAALYERGVHIDWQGFDRDYPRRKVSLPTYPFQRQTYRLGTYEPAAGLWRPDAALHSGHHPLLGRRILSPISQEESQFESSLSPDAPVFLQDHQVHRTIILPGVCFLETALAAGAAVLETDCLLLEEVSIQQPLLLSEHRAKLYQLLLAPGDADTCTFRIFSLDEAESSSIRAWSLHVFGKVRRGNADGARPQIDVAALRARSGAELDVEGYYRQCMARGLLLGPPFQAIRQLWRVDDGLLGRIRIADHFLRDIDNYQFHPLLFDACMQVLIAAYIEMLPGEHLYLPVGLDRLCFHTRPEPELWSQATVRTVEATNGQTLVGDLCFFNDNGTVVAEVEGLVLRRAGRDELFQGLTREWSQRFYELTWQPLPRVSQQLPEVVAGNWLIFADRGGLGRGVAELLRARGAAPIVVYAGRDGQGTHADAASIDPDDPEAYRSLLQSCAHAADRPLQGVVHLWSLDTAPVEQWSPVSLDEAQRLCGSSTLFLARALAEWTTPAPPRLWFVTREAVPLDDRVPGLAQASLWGLAKTLALEHPQWWGGLIDVDASQSPERLVQTILEAPGEDLLALRADQRHAARLVRLTRMAHQAIPMRRDAAYLIIGGLGALGLQTARWLAAQGAGCLVLCGRRGAASVTARETVAQLQAQGVRVLVRQADVADQSAMAAILDEISVSGLSWRGIVHAGGVSQDCSIEAVDTHLLHDAWRAKVAGTWVLHQLTRHLELDFFVCFSSIAAVWGAVDQAHYAAANSFLDAFAHYRRGLGLPALSIDWGPWAGEGMATATRRRRLEQAGVRAMPPKLAVEALGILLGIPLAQVTVADIDWPRFKGLYEARGRPLLQHIEAPSHDAGLPRQQRAGLRDRFHKTPESEHEHLLVTYLQTEVGRLLGFAPSQLPAPYQGFFDMGMDSLMANELRARLGNELDLALSTTVLFKYTTIAQLAAYLIGELVGQKPRVVGSQASDDDTSAMLAQVEETSEDQVEHSISQELQALENLLQASQRWDA